MSIKLEVSKHRRTVSFKFSRSEHVGGSQHWAFGGTGVNTLSHFGNGNRLQGQIGTHGQMYVLKIEKIVLKSLPRLMLRMMRLL